MNKGNFALAALLVCLPTASWAGYHSWQAEYSAYSACTKAMQQEVGQDRKLRAYSDYWIEKKSRWQRRLFVNAIERKTDEPLKAVCDIQQRHRVASVTVSPGHFAEQKGRITVEVAGLDPEMLRPAD